MSTALCTPNGPLWLNATQAGVRPIETFFADRSIPVEHRTAGAHLIKKSNYPLGIILIPIGHDPTAVPAVLPVVVTDDVEATLTIEPANILDAPFGGGLVFV
jgi:hypothetical protein